MRTIFSILLISTLLSGCSVFGIATKGELRDLEESSTATRESLQRQLAQMNSQLDEVSKEIGQTLTELQQTEAREAKLQDRLDQMQTATATMQSQVGDMQTQVAGFHSDLSVISGQASLAQAQSQIALQAYLEQLLDERENLRQRLATLDEQIRSFRADQKPDTLLQEDSTGSDHRNPLP